MKVHIQMDSLAIVLVPEADHWNGTLDLLMVQFDDKGKVLKAEVRTSEFRVTQATRETWTSPVIASTSTCPCSRG